MSNAIIDGTNIDTSVFSYSAPKANPSGGKVVNLYNKNFKPNDSYNLITVDGTYNNTNVNNVKGKLETCLNMGYYNIL
jgi:hypothetical protein